MRRLELEAGRRQEDQGVATHNEAPKAKIPNLPKFVDGKDELDSYLLRFERFAETHKWDRATWATTLSALLTGNALQVYGRLSDDDAKDYDTLKKALFRRYDLTEEGFRLKFRNSPPEEGESPAQFIAKLKNFLKKWMEQAGADETFEELQQLVVKEQFINAVSQALEIHLKEKAPANLDDLAKAAEQYLTAHGGELSKEAKVSKKPVSRPPKQMGTAMSDSPKDRPHEHGGKGASSKEVRCYKCNQLGHISSKCQSQDQSKFQSSNKKCAICNRFGHEMQDCRRFKSVKSGFAALESKEEETELPKAEVSSFCSFATPLGIDLAQWEACIKEGKFVLKDGNEIQCMSACFSNSDGPMPVGKGRVGSHSVQVLRDSGCSSVVIKKKYVDPKLFCEGPVIMRLADNSIRIAQKAKIHVDTPWLTGEVDAVCFPDAPYDLLIGNVRGARPAEDPDPEWKDPLDKECCAVTTRAQAKKEGMKPSTLLVPGSSKYKEVTRSKLCQLQKEDDTLKKLWTSTEEVTKGRQVVRYETRKGLLYRVSVHPEFNRGNPVSQVVIPSPLRVQVMSLAHESILGGHLGSKKTKDRISSEFYWTGMDGDVARFCKSCDICQKTISKGKVARAPLEKLPIIDTPFKRVSVDIVGKIWPPSEKGHQFILTIMDHASRYPDAVPLKNIDTETVAEALVDMFSRVGVPEEILSDLGTQFVSDCMKEVARLLSMRQLTTTPYHPMCNGLVEKFNGTLKTMLKRLCQEKPKQWHRYINAALFAYREVPQESTGFSPFEILYGHTVRGPMMILKELWTKDIEEPEVKSSYQYVLDLRERLEETTKLANDALKVAQGRYKHYYDRRARPRHLQVEDQVLILLPTDNNKLLMQWKGPFKVEKVMGKNDYGINVNGKVKTFHINMLKKYLSRPDDVPVTACAVFDNVCKASIENTEDDELLEMAPISGSETVNDVLFGSQLDKHQEVQVRGLLQQYQDIFTDIPGTSNLGEHRIELTSNEPVRSKPYPVPYGIRDSLKKEIQSMLDMGIIQKSTSPYASPVVMVRKSDGSNRVCIDYRKLNRMTMFDPEPMVNADGIFARLSESKFFTKIDFTKGYWQIKVRTEDVPKTAFVTPDGQYEFLKMPFGMVNAGATYVRCMRVLLQGLPNVESYIDDVLVHTKTWSEHLETLQELFQRIRNADLTVRPSKCSLATETVEFLGHTIEGDTLGLQEANIRKIQSAPPPKSKKEVRSFLGLTGFYRAYVPNYATIAAPLSDLTKKRSAMQWQEPQEKAYNTLKSILINKPVLRLPDFTKQFILRTDASDLGLGAMLLQEHEDGLFPVSYASRKLLDRERRYSTMEKECLAVVWAIQKFKMYLYDVNFTIQTDHQPLAFLNSSKFTNDRIMRWAMFLQNYRFRIEAIKGSLNVGADFLSRVVN
jgi:transposase InsO family protein